MKRILLQFALILAVAIPVFAGGDWHDDLISTMNSEKNVQSSLAVDRDTKSGKINQATYRYSFKNKALYKNLRAKLINREKEATNFILRPGDDGAILMKFTSEDGFRNYSLSHSKGKYHLIVAVNCSEPFGIGESSSSQENARRQAQIAREQAQRQRELTQRQAQQAREQAQRQREQAQRQAQQAREQAQRQREQAQRQREQAQRQREQAQRQREQAQIQREQAQIQREREQIQREQAQIQREQAQKQREQAQKQREQAQRQREQAQRQREQAQRQREQAQRQAQQARMIQLHNSKTTVITINSNSSTEADNISKQVKAAEKERKRLLNEN